MATLEDANKTALAPVDEQGTAVRQVADANDKLIERIVMVGDLGKLRPEERSQYYSEVCRSLGLNPLTRPFEYITLNGKLTLYARRDATEQLRKLHGVSVVITARELMGDVYVVTARATDRAGRTDESIGAVPVGGLRGESLANAYMKAETKAKRRVTLSICGLGMLDETEAGSIPNAPQVNVDMSTGEILEPATDPDDAVAATRRRLYVLYTNAAHLTDPDAVKAARKEAGAEVNAALEAGMLRKGGTNHAKLKRLHADLLDLERQLRADADPVDAEFADDGEGCSEQPAMDPDDDAPGPWGAGDAEGEQWEADRA